MERVERRKIEAGLDIVELLAEETDVFPSKGEARKMLKGNGVSLNKNKVALNKTVQSDDILLDQFILAQKGKRNYFLIHVK